MIKSIIDKIKDFFLNVEEFNYLEKKFEKQLQENKTSNKAILITSKILRKLHGNNIFPNNINFNDNNCVELLFKVEKYNVKINIHKSGEITYCKEYNGLALEITSIGLKKLLKIIDLSNLEE